MNSKIKVGDVVCYDGKGYPEYGIVIQTYWDQGDLDCYVAFWGGDIPTMDETHPPIHGQPYVLRYYASSLEHVRGLERDLATGIWKFNKDKEMGSKP